MYSMTSEVTKSVAKNALVVSLCYRGKDNYVKGEGTLKDVVFSYVSFSIRDIKGDGKSSGQG